MGYFMMDHQSRVPLYEQLKRQVLRGAALGLIAVDEALPSVRQLASELGINPNTVQKAYRELEREGLIYTVPGRGSFLAENTAPFAQVQAYVQSQLQPLLEALWKQGMDVDGMEDCLMEALLHFKKSLGRKMHTKNEEERHDSKH